MHRAKARAHRKNRMKCCYPLDLARIFHTLIEQKSGESVRRLENIEPNENTHSRFFGDRL